jgi:hypothetical protein
VSLTFEQTAAFLRPRLVYAAFAGTLVWVVWIGSLALGTWEQDVVGQLVSVDHLAFYSPARMIREGRGWEIYDHARLNEYQRGLFAPGVWEAFEAYRNPPFYALLYVPTAGLSYTTSAWLWNGIALACLAAGVRLLGAERPWRATAWALTFLPVFCVASYGQNSLLSFLALCASYRMLAMRRPFAAGLCAGLLCFKPPLLLGLVIWGLLDFRRLWPAAVGVAVTTATLCGVSYLIVPEAWKAFVGTLESNAQFDSFDWWKMHNARSFWRLLLPGTEPVPAVLWLLTAAAGVAWFVRIWWTRRDDLPTVFGASVLLTLWASPHTMVYEWALAVIPAVLWWTNRPHQRDAWLVLFALVWVAMFVSTDFGRVQEWLFKKKLGWQEPVIFQLSVPVLAWAGWKAVYLLSASPEPPGLLDPPNRGSENSP